MPAAKYHSIYQSLRSAIESGKYSFQQALPSEQQLTEIYDCSRNTVRRAIRQLAEESYVQSMQGKGVLVIYQKREQNLLPFSGIDSLREAAIRNNRSFSTKVVLFEEVAADPDMARMTGFAQDSGLFHLVRVHCLDGEARIIEQNYFLKDVVKGLTPEIAVGSVYEYMENTLGETVVTTRRKYTVERQTALDEQYLDLGGYQCVARVSCQSFNKEGVLFEYTCFRYCPDHLVFYEVAKR